MTSPFVFNVAPLLRGRDADQGMPIFESQTGPTPVHLGPEMIGVPEGDEVTVNTTLTPLGGGIMVDATVTGTLTGQCVRCLRTLRPDFELSVSEVFSADPDFITGDDEDDDAINSGDETPEIVDDLLDLEQSVLNEAGLAWPFNPTCEGGCPDDGESDVPSPDGISGEEDEDRIDPRWAGLEKFL